MQIKLVQETCRTKQSKSLFHLSLKTKYHHNLIYKNIIRFIKNTLDWQQYSKIVNWKINHPIADGGFLAAFYGETSFQLQLLVSSCNQSPAGPQGHFKIPCLKLHICCGPWTQPEQICPHRYVHPPAMVQVSVKKVCAKVSYQVTSWQRLCLSLLLLIFSADLSVQKWRGAKN